MAIGRNPLWLIWPRIHDAASARAAARFGSVASTLYCLGITATAVVAASSHSVLTLGSDGFVYAHIVVFAVLALLIWRMSRAAAIAALVLFLIDEVIIDVSTGTAYGVVVSAVFTLLFIHGARGTIAFRKFAAHIAT